MASFVSLLRGINVGGNKKIAMASLRELADDLGFTNPRTLLQSGNLVLESSLRSSAEIERRLETAVRDVLGLDVAIYVRSAREWNDVVKNNPFADASERDASHLLAMIFREKLAAASVAELEQSIVGSEQVIAVDRQLYIWYQDGIGTSKLTNALIEKKLGCRGTARNWNTVLKVQQLLSET